MARLPAGGDDYLFRGLYFFCGVDRYFVVCQWPKNRAKKFSIEVGGSDAHFLRQIGGGCTTFPGRTAEDLRQALADRATAGVLAFTMRLRELGADEVLAQQWRSLVVLPSKHVSNFVRKIVMGQS